MAYYSRKQILTDNSFFHLTWRCHNKEWLIKEKDTKTLYYKLLLKYKYKYNIKIFAYCFMNNHIHAVGYLEKVDDLSSFMKTVNSCFSKAINKKLERCGQVIMDRFKSPLIHTDLDMLRVMRYIDLNPYRANIVKHPKENKFSSYRFYAFGEKDALIDVSPAYVLLGNSDKKRRKNYIKIIEELIQENEKVLKEDFSYVYFIGEPNWVIEKYNNIKNKKKEDKLVLRE